MGLVRFIVSIAICQLAGVLGRYFMGMSLTEWYNELQKPDLASPHEIYTLVWTLLYLLMGLALFFVWQKSKERPVKLALFLFFLQLIGNVVWFALYFSMRLPNWALIDIGAVLLFTLLTILSFDRISKVASFLLLPYLFWLGYMAFINLSRFKLG